MSMAGRRLSLIVPLLAAILGFTASPACADAPARTIGDLNYNQDEIGPVETGLNSLDLHLPAGPDEANALRPLVVWVHGGGFMNGDKANRIADKARLFNGMGYVLASLNYRLSPDISESCCQFDPARVRAPDHIADVAEALGWLSQHISKYGGDPDRIILIGHSAGAQLVSLAATSPVWVEGRRVSRRQILGAVSLDTDSFNVREEASMNAPLQARLLAWNAFGTPGEEAAEARWDRMSPLLQADPSDPPFLFVTQAARPNRIAANQAMASALGEPSESVLGVPYDHEGINTALGAPSDASAETATVSRFVADLVSTARPAGVKITKRPPKRVTVRVKRRGGKRAFRKVRRRVVIAFKGTGRTAGLQCRIDRKRFRKCRSPETYRLGLGKHTFRVRPLYPSGRPGMSRKVRFRIVSAARSVG